MNHSISSVEALKNSSIANNTMSASNEANSQDTDIAYNFDINLLDNQIKEIHEHTVSSNIQISIAAVQNLAYVCAYSGLDGCPLYTFDLSPGASGKDSAVDKAIELYQKPILDLQNKRKAEYDYERQSSDDKLPIKSYYCIHTSDATEQGIIEGFKATKAQFIAIGETSNKLRKKEDSLTTFVTRIYGKSSVIKPNYKKDLGSTGDLTIDGIQTFYYGNSNFKMLGKSTFTYHIVGGLLNRCILVYNTYVRSFEDRPISFELSEEVLKETHLKVERLLQFGNKHKDMKKPTLIQTDIYTKFDKHVYDLTIKNRGTEIEYFYKRTMQNTNAIIYTFHYLICAEKDQWTDYIEPSTISLGVNFMKYILKGYDALIDEVIGATAEERDEAMIEKLHSTILSLSQKSHSLKLKHREIYRAMHINKKEYDSHLSHIHYKTDRRYLYVSTDSFVTSVTSDKESKSA